MRTPSGEMKTGLKKGAWSLEEDLMLVSYIKRYGIWNWSHMPKVAGLSRSGKSCRLRWMNYLKPNLKRGSFSKEEEEIILHFHSILGNRWSAIASKIPGRSDNEVKNHWHTNLKKHATNEVPKKPEQKDMNKSLEFEGHNVEKIQAPPNHGNDVMDSSLSLSAEDDSSSSSCTATSKDLDVDFIDDFHHIGSPGTDEDLRYFWKQLSPLENLESGNTQWDMFFDPMFQD